MVLKPEPIFRAVDAIGRDGTAGAVILMSPQGRRFTQADAEAGAPEHAVILCGRYEGFDERVREQVAEELSIGDYVLTGGELPALVILDAVARLVPGVVGDEQSVAADSFNRGLLDFPHYTRPALFRDLMVPGSCSRATRGDPAMAEAGGGRAGRSTGGRTCWRRRAGRRRAGS